MKTCRRFEGGDGGPPRSEDQTSAAQTLKCQAGMEDAFEIGSTRFKVNGLQMMLKMWGKKP